MIVYVINCYFVKIQVNRMKKIVFLLIKLNLIASRSKLCGANGLIKRWVCFSRRSLSFDLVRVSVQVAGIKFQCKMKLGKSVFLSVADLHFALPYRHARSDSFQDRRNCEAPRHVLFQRVVRPSEKCDTKIYESVDRLSSEIIKTNIFNWNEWEIVLLKREMSVILSELHNIVFVDYIMLSYQSNCIYKYLDCHQHFRKVSRLRQCQNIQFT